MSPEIKLEEIMERDLHSEDLNNEAGLEVKEIISTGFHAFKCERT